MLKYIVLGVLLGNCLMTPSTQASSTNMSVTEASLKNDMSFLKDPKVMNGFCSKLGALFEKHQFNTTLFPVLPQGCSICGVEPFFQTMGQERHCIFLVKFTHPTAVSDYQAFVSASYDCKTKVLLPRRVFAVSKGPMISFVLLMDLFKATFPLACSRVKEMEGFSGIFLKKLSKDSKDYLYSFSFYTKNKLFDLVVNLVPDGNGGTNFQILEKNNAR